jgi:hypothetical protein
VARTVAQSRVSDAALVVGDIAYMVAGREDEADLRRLLADNPTDGWIRLAFTREPDAFAASAVMGHRHATIIAREKTSGEPVGMCEWSARRSYIDGEARLLAYLGGLRVAPTHRHRLRVIKGGFQAVRTLLHREPATPYALTAIASDNAVALRLLGANLPGMPAYVPVESFSTFALRPCRAAPSPIHVEPATHEDLPAIAVCLSRTYCQYQFAPAWTARDLADPSLCKDLRPDSFLVVRRGPGVAACVALWDQSAFKQTIVRGYRGGIGWTRPLLNMAGPLLGAPRLPAPGEPLRQVYLSHLAVEGNDADLFLALIDAGLAEARRRGFALALTGLASRHPLARVLKTHFRPREYRALLHLVRWHNGESAVEAPAAHMPHVEIAVL